MTVSSSTRFGLVLATASGDPGPTHVTYTDDNQAVEDLAAIRIADVHSARPAAGAANEGAVFFSEDTIAWAYSDGSSWYDLLPAGILLPYAGTTAPPGWLLCDGSAVSRTTFAALFAVLSTTYGPGDGSTTFNLPDMRNRITRGSNAAAGGAPSPLLPGASATGHYDAGDSHSHGGNTTGTALTAAQLPSHTHPASVSDPGHAHGVSDGGHSHDDSFAHSWSATVAGSATRTPASSTPTSGSDGVFAHTTGVATTGIGIVGATTGIGVSVNGQSGTTGQTHSHPIPSQAAVYPPSLSLAHIIKC